MPVLNREGLLSRQLKHQTIEFSDGTSLIVRALKAKEAEDIWAREGKESTKANVLLFAMAVVDEQGKRLFDPENKADLDAIGDLGFDLVLEVVRVVSELSGLKKDSDQTLKN